jgi:ferric-dicitrate binding protein FerR (iron transport regulator)
MAAKTKAAKAASAAAAAKSSPYVQRVIQDEDLRDNMRDAFEAARKAYDRLSNGKAPAKALLDDKKLQKNLQEAAVNIRDAGQALREGPKRKKRRGRKLLLLLVGVGIALAVSEDLRNKLLDALFGKEEEFEYTSTTSPSSPPPPPPPPPAPRGASVEG